METAAESGDLIRALQKTETEISFQTWKGNFWSTGIQLCMSRDGGELWSVSLLKLQAADTETRENEGQRGNMLHPV